MSECSKLPHRGITECICLDGAYDDGCEGCEPDEYMMPLDSIFYWRRKLADETAKGNELQAEVKRYEEALKFYANPSDYIAPYTGGLGKLYYDCGETAKQALEKGVDEY